jgi:hypothetical protein
VDLAGPGVVAPGHTAPPVYVPLWYGGFSGLPVLDFMGVLRGPDGAVLGLAPEMVATAGVAVLVVVLLLATRRPLRA